MVACLPLAAVAQEDDEYRMEIGAGAGAVSYVGDFNGNLLKDMQPWGALTAKYHLNPRMALALAIGTGKIKGSSDGADTWYPIEPYSFSHQPHGSHAEIRVQLLGLRHRARLQGRPQGGSLRGCRSGHGAP